MLIIVILIIALSSGHQDMQAFRKSEVHLTFTLFLGIFNATKKKTTVYCVCVSNFSYLVTPS